MYFMRIYSAKEVEKVRKEAEEAGISLKITGKMVNGRIQFDVRKRK